MIKWTILPRRHRSRSSFGTQKVMVLHTRRKTILWRRRRLVTRLTSTTTFASQHFSYESFISTLVCFTTIAPSTSITNRGPISRLGSFVHPQQQHQQQFIMACFENDRVCMCVCGRVEQFSIVRGVAGARALNRSIQKDLWSKNNTVMCFFLFYYTC